MKLDEFQQYLKFQADRYARKVAMENTHEPPQLSAKTWWEDFVAHMNEAIKEVR